MLTTGGDKRSTKEERIGQREESARPEQRKTIEPSFHPSLGKKDRKTERNTTLTEINTTDLQRQTVDLTPFSI